MTNEKTIVKHLISFELTVDDFDIITTIFFCVIKHQQRICHRNQIKNPAPDSKLYSNNDNFSKTRQNQQPAFFYHFHDNSCRRTNNC